MKKLLIAAAVGTVTLGAASSAFAVTAETGIVNITGTVPSQCSVVTGGTAGGNSFGATFALTQMVDNVGHLSPSPTSFTTGAVLGNFQINCTKANPLVQITARSMTIGGTSSPATPPTGYDDVVGYHAYADFATVVAPSTTGTVTKDVVSSVVGASSTQTDLGGPTVYLQNTSNNVIVRADTFTAAPGAIIIAGSYTGTITVTITPA